MRVDPSFRILVAGEIRKKSCSCFRDVEIHDIYIYIYRHDGLVSQASLMERIEEKGRKN